MFTSQCVTYKLSFLLGLLISVLPSTQAQFGGWWEKVWMTWWTLE